MRYCIAATVLALATAAFAQERAPTTKTGFSAITAPSDGEEVLAGTTYTIEWTAPAEYANIQINLILIGGNTTRDGQVPYLNITRGVDISVRQYDWAIPSDLGGFIWNGIIIEDAADTFNNYQYSTAFKLLRNPDAAASSDVSSALPTASSTTSTAVSSSEIETSSAPISTTGTPASNSITTPTPSDESTSPPAESGPAETTPGGGSGADQAKAGLLAVFGGLVVAFML